MTIRMRSWLRRDGERGASALEFALVSPILFLVVFGIFQYGMYFNDVNLLRQGVRETARTGVVENFTYPGCTTGASADKLLCIAGKQTGSSLTASPVFKVYAPDGWVKGKSLRVCSAAITKGGVGLAPLPDGGRVRAMTQMIIEQEALKASWVNPTPPSDPTGGSWSWC
ncbi:TadE/TadG family type IV pilus assembly protein [Nocardioides scoriae]|nr:TadE family protein [Nocardioides scoriae]